ncbi:MAG: DUF2007 domain-containing protein [Bacteroidales bacterium]|jgi:hypothetical protein|nr:DUF2007 domain-containing protein [Bacteroidales bacterium]MDP2235099.1 DUF2007 domain-containing protein [Bacteroidales bacterium]
MTTNSDLIKVFTGRQVLVHLLKDELESMGIGAMIRNDFHSGAIAGFYGGTPSAIDLYILDADKEKAMPLVEDFIARNENG